MEFALIVGPVYPPRQEMASIVAFSHHMEFCRVANECGFDGLSVNHHYLVGPDVQCFQPLVMCARLMTLYPHLYVVTTVLLLPYYNPVAIAEEVATLDMMAPGRLILGVGQGYREVEASAMGIEPTSRRSRMVEGIAAMKRLWADAEASFSGRHYTFTNVDIGLRPQNPAGPPILVAADKLRTVARVPESGGDYWLPSARHSTTFLRAAMPVYRAALEEHGRPFNGIPLQRDICVGRSRRDAEDLVRTSFEYMLHLQHRWGQPGERYDLPFDDLKQDRVLLGTPEEVAEEIIGLHNEFGAKFMLFRVYTPGMAPEAAMEQIRIIGEEVLPLVRRSVGHDSLFAPHLPAPPLATL